MKVCIVGHPEIPDKEERASMRAGKDDVPAIIPETAMIAAVLEALGAVIIGPGVVSKVIDQL
jgi:hypothetical protein